MHGNHSTSASLSMVMSKSISSSASAEWVKWPNGFSLSKANSSKTGIHSNLEAQLIDTSMQVKDCGDKYEQIQGREKADAQKTPFKGKYKKAYCIFERSFGHGSTFCLNNKFDYDYKMNCAK